MQTNDLFFESLKWSDNDYTQILNFALEHKRISYSDFDRSTIDQINLFTLRENFDFSKLEETLDKIIQCIPAIRRIFVRPITRLTDNGAILPVESVRVINNQTVIHACSHTELWNDITSDGIKPRKLLTLNNEDEYCIYENIAFVRAIKIILYLVSFNLNALKNMLYSGRNLSLNLLERENHTAYYLALGKLHFGYVRDYDKYLEPAERCYNKLIYIDRVMRSGLNSPVYKHCKKLNDKIILKKTNIFRMHKDYHRIYALLKWFSDEGIEIDKSTADTHSESTSKGYEIFCLLLSVFAAGHYNFKFSDDQCIDLFETNTVCSLDQWKLTLECIDSDGVRAMCFTFYKDSPYKIILIPVTDDSKGKVIRAQFMQHFDANEYLIASPYQNGSDQIFLSLFDIESFRRLQQLLQRGLIYSDKRRNICPFCANELRFGVGSAKGDVFECSSCRTQIHHLICPETSFQYFATKIKNYIPSQKAHQTDPDDPLYDRYVESLLHFRNVTKISDKCEIICPICGKIH